MKRITSLLLAMIMALVSVLGLASVSFAGEKDSEFLKQAITKAKSLITVPANCSEFEYDIDEETQYSRKAIRLNWTEKEGNAFVMVTLDGDLNLVRFTKSREEKQAGAAEITREQAAAKAKAYLDKLAPKLGGVFKQDSSASNSYMNSYAYVYKLYVNDVPCDFISARVEVSKTDGSLVSYEAELGNGTREVFPAADKVIDSNEAKEIFKALKPVELMYKSYYDLQGKKLKIYGAYQLKRNMMAVDAVTGKEVNVTPEFRVFTAEDSTEGMDIKSANMPLTKEEQAEVDKTLKMISLTQAENVVKAAVKDASGKNLENHYLMKENQPDQNYIYILSYDKVHARVNAETGVLESYSLWTDGDRVSRKSIGYNAAKKIAEAEFNKLCPDLKDVTELQEEPIPYDNEDENYQYNFRFARMVNGLPFESNYVYIGVDAKLGKVVEYDRSWYDTVAKDQFPETGKYMDADKAFDTACGLSGFGLVYRKDIEGKVVLVYDFLGTKEMTLDAATGKELDRKGEVKRTKGDYEDIEKSWAKDIILSLKEEGYYLSGSKFMPKAVITQQEFFTYLYSPHMEWYGNVDKLYNSLIRDGILKKEEVNKNAALTRQDAAKFICRYMGYDKLASQSRLFARVFKDENNASYRGYVAVAYGLGVMKGKADGTFGGGATMTRAEAASVIYNLLKVDR